MQKFFLPFFILIILYSLLGCANQGQLTGGKKDTRPPQVDSQESTPNYQTNFQKQTINLVFDEWVQLANTNQIVISPPLKSNKIDVSLKKKTVQFKFDDDEVLRENATYTINFDKSVQDLTERNPAEDLRFVFSTGDFIDSLEVGGIVVDAFDKKPVKDVIVMLYDNLADTVVRTEKPFYFGRTDDDGHFIIKNVRADSFKVFALVDGNSNYLFDNNTEKIGFLETPVVVTDSTKTELSLQIFQEEALLQLMGEDKKKYGRLAFAFNRKPSNEEFKITYQDVGQQAYFQDNRDSIILWYDVPKDTSWNVYIAIDTSFTDTIRIQKISRSTFLKDKKSILAQASNPSSKIVVNPTKPLSITFKYPLENIDTTFVELLADTLLQKVIPQLEIDSTDRRNLLVKFNFKENTPYQLKIFPNAISDFYGLTNDTIIQNLDIKSKTEFGDLTLKVVDLQVDKSYVLELLDKSNKLIETLLMSGDTTFTKVLKSVETGKYSVRMIQDTNENGKWDTGNYDNQSQPELLFSRELEEVRAGWEVNATVSADEKIQPKKATSKPPPGATKSGSNGGKPKTKKPKGGRGN